MTRSTQVLHSKFVSGPQGRDKTVEVWTFACVEGRWLDLSNIHVSLTYTVLTRNLMNDLMGEFEMSLPSRNARTRGSNDIYFTTRRSGVCVRARGHGVKRAGTRWSMWIQSTNPEASRCAS